MPAETTTWDLRSVPVQALARELYRRGVDPLSCVPDLRFPGLVIRTSHYLVEWCGRVVKIRPREMEVLLVVARCHPHGATSRRIATEVFGVAREDTRNTVRRYVLELRRALPGLLNAPSSGEAVYRLAGVERLAQRARVRIVGA